MSEQSPTPNQPAPPAKRKPWPIIVIAALTAFWMIGPYVSYYTGWFVPDETSNNGTLIEPPVHVADLLRDNRDAQSPTLSELDDDQWHLLIPVILPCNKACEKNLYTTRQVHTRLGEKGLRVQRIAVNLAGDQGEAFIAKLAEEHPRLTHIALPRASWTNWLAATNLPDVNQEHYYLLVHPAGHAILYYTAGNHGNDLLEDVKHGLRFTPE